MPNLHTAVFTFVHYSVAHSRSTILFYTGNKKRRIKNNNLFSNNNLCCCHARPIRAELWMTTSPAVSNRRRRNDDNADQGPGPGARHEGVGYCLRYWRLSVLHGQKVSYIQRNIYPQGRKVRHIQGNLLSTSYTRLPSEYVIYKVIF